MCRRRPLGRALPSIESERPDAIFHDPYARRLAGDRGVRIMESLPKAKSWGWPMVVRTAVIGRADAETVDEGPDTVLNLAAGLDAAPLPPPAAVRAPVDRGGLPRRAGRQGGMSWRSPAGLCTRRHRLLDLTDVARRRALFAEIGRSSRKVLVVSERTVDLPRTGTGRGAGGGPCSRTRVWLVTDRHRRSPHPQTDGKDLGQGGCRRERALSVRARGRNPLLRLARLGRGGVPVHLGRGEPVEPRRSAARVALAADRQ